MKRHVLFFSFLLSLALHIVIVCFLHEKISFKRDQIKVLNIALSDSFASRAKANKQNHARIKLKQKTHTKKIKQNISPKDLAVKKIIPIATSKQINDAVDKKAIADESYIAKQNQTNEINQINQIAANLSNSPPTVKFSTRPVYPEISRNLGEEGKVKLSVLVGENGEVLKVEIIKSSGFARLDKAAKKSIMNWQFNPARILGKTKEAIFFVPIVFSLQEKAN